MKNGGNTFPSLLYDFISSLLISISGQMRSCKVRDNAKVTVLLQTLGFLNFCFVEKLKELDTV